MFTANSKAGSIYLQFQHDEDVSNLAGISIFNRAFLEVSKHDVEEPMRRFIAHGANHNSFNAEWQESDSKGC